MCEADTEILPFLKWGRWKKRGKKNPTADFRKILIGWCSFCWRKFLLHFNTVNLPFWHAISSSEKTQHFLRLLLKYKIRNTASLGIELEQQRAICCQCLVNPQLCLFLCFQMWVVDYPPAQSLLYEATGLDILSAIGKLNLKLNPIWLYLVLILFD